MRPTKDASYVLNRLEVDDVEVTLADGTTKLTQGTWNLARRESNGTYTSSDCSSYPTHTGVDVANGTYRIVSTANTASGTVTSTQEVTVP